MHAAKSMKAYVVDCAPHAFPFCSFSISGVGDSGDLPLCRQKSNALQSGTGHFSCQTRNSVLICRCSCFAHLHVTCAYVSVCQYVC